MATVIDSLLIQLGFDADTSGAASFESGIGKVIKTAGKLAAVGGAAVGAFGALVIKTAGDFEESMQAVSAVSGAVGKEFDALRDMAKKLGAETAFSATEAANGMEYLAMAGLNTEQVLSTIPNALSLAAAGSIDLAQSADILSNIMSGMGIAAEESGKVADVLAQAAAGANTNVSALGEAMKYVAPIAKTMGYTLEETASAIGILGNAGIAGAQAGTSLRAIYTRIASDDGAKETFKDLGIATTDASGKMRSMTDVVTDLQQSTKSLSSEKQIELFKDIAGAEAMGALAVLVDGVANDSLTNLTSKLQDAKGAADEMAATRLEGFNGQIKIMKSALEGLMLEVADTGLLNLATEGIKGVTEALGKLAEYIPVAKEKIVGFFDWFDENSEKIGNTFKVMGAVAAVIGASLAIMYAPAIAGFILMKATGLLSFLILQAAAIASAAATAAAWLVAFAPFLLIGAVIAVVIGLLWLIYQNWDAISAGIKAEWDALWARVKEAASTAIEWVKAKIQEVKDAFSSVVDTISAIWSGLWEGVKSMASGAIQFVIDKVQSLITLISGALGSITKISNFKMPSFSVPKMFSGGGNGGSRSYDNSVKQSIKVSSIAEAISFSKATLQGQRVRNSGMVQ